jgi:hypothetical protein
VVKGYLIGTDRSKTAVQVSTTSVQQLQEYVGGYLEAQYDEPRTVIFWINEDGKNLGLPVNELATAYWWLVNPAFINHDMLVGNVVITGGPDRNGDITSITPAMEHIILDTYLQD